MATGNKLENTIHKHHNSIIKIKDEKFSVDDIGTYDLVIYISQESFKCSAASEKLGRCVFFESFDFTKNLNTQEILDQCKIIFDDHHILQAGFWKTIRCVIGGEFFTLIPKDLFEKDNVNKLLALNFPDFDARSISSSYFNPNSGPVVSLFGIPKKFISFFSKYYPKKDIKYLHELTCTLEGIITTAVSGSSKPTISSFIHGKKISIIAVDKGKILFFNTFKFNNPEDAIYYVLSVMAQLKINSQNVKLALFGNIVRDSPLFSLASKYIDEVVLGERPKLFYFNYEFDEVPTQWHYETFCAYLCK